MLLLLAFTLLGIGAGTFTGLIPGVHVNNIAPFLIGLTTTSALDKYEAVAFIVSMMMTHTFLDFIPATFLGVPEKDTALSVLPAHKFVQRGKGYEVIKLTALGSLGALIFCAILIGPSTPLVSPVYELISPFMHILLACIVAAMILSENSWSKRIGAAVIFLISGFMGLLILDTNINSGNSALMPLLGGLFGLSVLLGSINTENSIRKQIVTENTIQIKGKVIPIITGASAGFLTGIIPGVGPAQGTFITQTMVKEKGNEAFLVGVSGVNTAKALLSFVALYAIGKPRSGSAVVVNEILNVSQRELILLIGVSLIAGGTATIIHLKIGKIFAKRICSIPYRQMCFIVITGIIAFSIYYSGLIGLLILSTSTSLGLIPSIIKVKRSNCMGVLMIPVILHFSGMKDIVMKSIGLG